MKCCGTCKWLDMANPVLHGYNCEYPIKSQTTCNCFLNFPDSAVVDIIHKRTMSKDEGKTCACWEHLDVIKDSGPFTTNYYHNYYQIKDKNGELVCLSQHVNYDREFMKIICDFLNEKFNSEQ